MPVFPTYMQGQQLGMEQGRNALARQQAFEQREREQGLRNILSQAYQPATPAIEALPAEPTVGIAAPGETIMHEAIPGQEAQPGQMDTQSMLGAMYEGGFGPEAMAFEQKLATAKGRLPMSLQELTALKDMTPEQEAKFWNIKRGAQTKLINGIEHQFVQGRGWIPLTTLEAEASAQAEIEGAKTGAKTEARIKSEVETQAKIDLPQYESSAEELLSLTDQVLEHPGKSFAIGAASVIPVVPGTPQADFVTLLDQVGGKQFMEAYKTLKGGGQITEVEGKKATEAMARMRRSQSQKSFNKGVRDFQDVVKKGLKRARNLAGKKKAALKIGDTISGPDGNQYIILTLKPDGAPDDVELAQ